MSLADFAERTQQSRDWPNYTVRQRTALASDYIRAKGMAVDSPDAKAILELAAGPVQGLRGGASMAEGVRQGLQGTVVGAGLHAVGAVNAPEPMGTPVDPNAGVLAGAVQGLENLVGDTASAAGDVLSGQAFQGVSGADTLGALGQAGVAAGTGFVAGLPEALAGGFAGRAVGRAAAGAAARLGGATAEEAAIAAGRAAGPLPRAADATARTAQAAGYAAGDVGVNAAAAGGTAYEGNGDVQAALRAATLGAAMGLAVNLPTAQAAASAWRQRNEAKPASPGPLSEGLRDAPAASIGQVAEQAPVSSALALPAPGQTSPTRGGFQQAQVAAALADHLPATMIEREAAKMMADYPELRQLYAFDQGLQAYVRADLAAPTRVELVQSDAVMMGPAPPAQLAPTDPRAFMRWAKGEAPMLGGTRPVEGPLPKLDPFASQREGQFVQRAEPEVTPKFDANLRRILGLMDEASAARTAARAEAAPTGSDLRAVPTREEPQLPATKVDDATLARFFQDLVVPVERPADQVLTEFVRQEVRPRPDTPAPPAQIAPTDPRAFMRWAKGEAPMLGGTPAPPAQLAPTDPRAFMRWAKGEAPMLGGTPAPPPPSDLPAGKAVEKFLADMSKPAAKKPRTKAQRRPKAEAPTLGALLADESGGAMPLSWVAENAGVAAQAAKRAASRAALASASVAAPVAKLANALGRPVASVFDALEIGDKLTAPIGDFVRDVAGRIPGGRLVISNAGVSRDMLEARQLAVRFGNSAVARLRDVGDAAHALPIPDREDLYRAMTKGEPLQNPDLAPMLEELRGAVDTARQTQLALKQLSPELYAKRKDTYLPRSFAKYMDENASPLSRVLARVVGNPIKGKARRGEKVALTVGQYREYMRPWKIVSKQDDTFTLSDGVDTKTVGAADVDNYMSDWYALTKIEDTHPDNKMIQAQRDYSEAELERMGEVLDVAYAIDVMTQEVAHDVSSGALFRRITEVPGLVKTREEVAPSQYLDAFQEVDGYVWFPVDYANKGSGGFKWGALGGRFVRKDIADQLRTADDLAQLAHKMNVVKKVTLVNAAKQSQTIMGGPQYYLLNAAANQPIYIAYGGQQGNLVLAVQGLLERDELARRLENDGRIRAGQIREDMGAQLKAASAQGLGAVTSIWDTAVKFGSDGAQFTDDMYRYGLVKSLMDRGYSYDKAARMTSRFYDPLSQTAPVYALVETVWQPYIKIAIWSLFSVPRMMAERPASAVAMYASYLALSAMLEEASGLTTPEEKKASQTRLPPFKRNPKIGDTEVPFAQRTLPLPIKDSLGQRLDLDIAGIMPWGAAVQPVPEEGPYKGLPGMMRPGTPAATLMFGVQGTNPSTGRDLIEPSSDNRARFIAEYFLPRYMGRDVFRLYDWFVGGTPNLADRTRDPYTVMAGALGVRLDPRNTQREITYKTKQLQGRVTALRTELEKQASLVQELRQAGQDAAIPAAAARLEELRGTFGAKVKRYQEELESARVTENDREAVERP